MAAVDRFQTDHTCVLAVCNLIAGGVGLTLTAGTHVIFQDLDWVPANHRQAEDRAYRMGQTERVTVEYMLADGTLDGFIADLLETKLRLIGAVEGDEVPDASDPRGPLREAPRARPRAPAGGQARAGHGRGAREAGGAGEGNGLAGPGASSAGQDLLDQGVREFRSSRDPSQVYRVTFGGGGHLECTL